MPHDHIGHRSWQDSDLSIGRECQNLPSGRKKGITKTKRHRLPMNETADCEDSLTQRSWRRPPSAGKRHDQDQLTFVAQWAEKESFGVRGLRIVIRVFVITGFDVRQFPADLFKDVSVAGAQKTIVTDLVEASGKDMLEEATDELRCLKSHGFPPTFPGIFVAECDLALLYRKDSAVGDGGLVNIPGEIREGLLC